MGKIQLQKVTMVCPSARGVYSPSRLPGARREMSEAEFLVDWADSAQVILVSFERDGVSNAQRCTGYAKGLSGWWIEVRKGVL